MDSAILNQYIPMFIKEEPWYWKIQGSSDPLIHQRAENATHDLEPEKLKYYKPAEIKKFKKGSCTNCGSEDHNAKNCFERPRKIGAKWTNQDLKGNFSVQGGLDYSWKMKYDEKWDLWAGYDPNTYTEVVQKWDSKEKENQEHKKQEIKSKILSGTLNKDLNGSDIDALSNLSDISSESEEEEKEVKKKVEVQHLRQRGVVQKYLQKISGEKPEIDPSLLDQDLFVKQAEQRGVDLDQIANPSQTELVYKEFQKKKQGFQNDKISEILKKYGGEQYLKQRPKEEDIEVESFDLGHTETWGSLHHNAYGTGYKCCHQFDKNAKCTG